MSNATNIFQCEWCHHISQDVETHREHLRRSGCIKKMANDQLSQQIAEEDQHMQEVEGDLDLDLGEEITGDYEMEEAIEEGEAFN